MDRASRPIDDSEIVDKKEVRGELGVADRQEQPVSLVDQRAKEHTKQKWDLHDQASLAEVRHLIEEIPDEQSDIPVAGNERSVGDVMNNAAASQAVREEKLTVKDKKILVRYLSKESLHPAWGYGGGNVAAVRDDLPPRVKKFVLAHEIYHCTDKAKWGGWIGGEIRANVVPALKDPIGAVSALVHNLSPDRIKFYIKRFREGR